MAQNNYSVVTRTSNQGFTTSIETDTHTLISDEPKEVGGGDKGPTPYDLLVAAIGACTGMTIQMYAKRKSMPLTNVTVYLSHTRTHIVDCIGCEDNDNRIEVISREIALEGNLSETERNKLIEIADKCPVGKTLANGIKIETRLRG